ncbi:MAG: hypothetical protein PF689_08325 [Deltaproteobacteria bacterium]|jgi:hypothetical protein|nr:hypothetical protein [Deltaproteobacteria bacterium]
MEEKKKTGRKFVIIFSLITLVMSLGVVLLYNFVWCGKISSCEIQFDSFPSVLIGILSFGVFTLLNTFLVTMGKSTLKFSEVVLYPLVSIILLGILAAFIYVLYVLGQLVFSEVNFFVTLVVALIVPYMVYKLMID